MPTSPVWSIGQVIIGGVFIVVPTITSKSQSISLTPSLAVMVTTVVPIPTIVPASGD